MNSSRSKADRIIEDMTQAAIERAIFQRTIRGVIDGSIAGVSLLSNGTLWCAVHRFYTCGHKAALGFIELREYLLRALQGMDDQMIDMALDQLADDLIQSRQMAGQSLDQGIRDRGVLTGGRVSARTRSLAEYQAWRQIRIDAAQQARQEREAEDRRRTLEELAQRARAIQEFHREATEQYLELTDEITHLQATIAQQLAAQQAAQLQREARARQRQRYPRSVRTVALTRGRSPAVQRPGRRHLTDMIAWETHDDHIHTGAGSCCAADPADWGASR